MTGLLGTPSSYAEKTLYIRDTLYVPLRSGQSTQYRIVHKGLPSGTAVIELENNEETGYSLVRTPKGTEGWVQSQYLMDRPSAKNALAQAKVDVQKLTEKNKQLNEQLNALNQKDRSATKNISDLSKNNESLTNELAQIKKISANAITLNSDNSRLLEENQGLKNQVDILTADNQRLNDDKASEEFINGAFAVLIGVMITLAVPRLWPQKRTDWA